MHAARLAHNARRSVRHALFALRHILGGVPGVGDLAGFRRQGDGIVIAFGRGQHAIAPILGHEGNPVASQIDGGGGLGGLTGPRRRLRTEPGRYR